MTTRAPLRLLRYELDPAFEERLVTSPAVRGWLTELGELAVPEVQRRAPERLGFLKRDITFVIEVVNGRLVLRVVSRDFKSSWHEFGTERSAKRPFLRPGVETALPGAKWTAGRR